MPSGRTSHHPCVERHSRRLSCQTDQRIAETSDEICKGLAIRLVPVGQRSIEKPATRKRDCPDDLPAVIGQLRRAFAPIRIALASADEVKAFQLRELPADGCVVSPDQIGEFRDAERTSRAERDEQRKQRAVEADPGFAQQGLIALRAVQKSDEVDQP
jgi:hypothetical protein